MKKFTNLNESVSTPKNPLTIKDAIINLIEETLSVEMTGIGSENVKSDIIGKDELVILLEKMVEIQKTKQTITVLETIKVKSLHNLDLNWINEAIENENKKIE